MRHRAIFARDRAPAPERIRRSWAPGSVLTALATACWALACTALLGTMAVSHVAPMPAFAHPATSPTFAAFARLGAGRDRSLLVHVIATDCDCTRRLIAHLMAAHRTRGVDELIVFVGDASRWRAAAAEVGLPIVEIDADRLWLDYGVQAAPVLAVVSARGQVEYLGGYFDHPAARQPLDADIVKAWQRGTVPAPLPVFGCAVGTRLRERLDPLGLVYQSSASPGMGGR